MYGLSRVPFEFDPLQFVKYGNEERAAAYQGHSKLLDLLNNG
jgi:hypothetical protein